MNVVDSSGWLEYFAAASNAEAFARVIAGAEDVGVPALVVFEVGRRVWQQRGEAAAREAMDVLNRFPVIPLDATISRRAVAIAMTHKLAMADSVIYATAEGLGATFWTQDKDFDGLSGVHYIPKPTS